LAISRKQEKAIFSKRTKGGNLITVSEGRDFFQGKDVFKISGTDFAGTDSKFTQNKKRAFEIANAKVKSENKRFDSLKKIKEIKKQ